MNRTEIEELFNKLKSNLFLKHPDLESLRSYIIDCGFPGIDKRDVYNRANEIQEYVIENFSDKISDIESYDSTLNWILTKASFDELKEMISSLYKDVEYLLSWKKQDFELEYNKMSFMGFIDNESVEYLDQNIYYSEINQLTDKLILLNSFDTSTDHLFDLNGNYLNGKIGQCISENYSENYFGGNLQINLVKNDLITVRESGNGYYYETCEYMLNYNGGDFQIIKQIDNEFEPDINESKKNAYLLHRKIILRGKPEEKSQDKPEEDDLWDDFFEDFSIF